jgi:hypothetical protein
MHKYYLLIPFILFSTGQAFALPDCPEEGVRHNCFGTFTSSGGIKYVGGFKDGKEHGQGTATGPKGDKYVGEFRDGLPHGQGTYTYADGSQYVGGFRDGEWHGQGTMTFADGSKYVGEWKDGKANGQGIHTLAIGAQYVGGFRNGAYDGQGTYTFADDAKYVGGFRDDKRHGQGTLTYADGGQYVGEWKDNEWHGQGTATLADGGQYVGEWKNKKMHGQGTHTFADGGQYVGEWKDGKKHGQGTYTLADGSQYVGGFRDGEWHGQGTMTFADGDKYVGEFKDGIPNGQGTLTYADGGQYVGEWKDSEPNGQGTKTLANGDQYVGGFRNGKFDGQGTLTNVSGRVEEGVWKDGEFQYAQKVTPPVVAKSSNPDEVFSAASGSGFAVSSEGHVVTNYHVIEGCQDVKIHNKGESIKATVVTFDTQNDLAVLKGDFQPSVVLPLSNRKPELLQEIYVAGFPFGQDFSTSIKVTKGIISSLSGIGNNFSNIQIDAALQPGNSGGPILDERGNVVGVAVAKLDLEKVLENFGVIPENTNFGVKTSVARTVLESSDIRIPSANTQPVSTSELARMMTGGTYYLSCWMTMAQMNQMKSRKVIFKNLD